MLTNNMSAERQELYRVRDRHEELVSQAQKTNNPIEKIKLKRAIVANINSLKNLESIISRG